MARPFQTSTGGKTLHTIGHSTRAFDEFLEILCAHGITHIVDVRAFPRSRRHPQFNTEALARELPAGDIGYTWMQCLGGRRRAAADSVNAGWRNEAFRGYADYMQTAEFRAAVDELIVLAERGPTAIMCAEAVPWRCHRSLIADALLARGWAVIDIYDERAAKPHALTPFARVEGERVTYPHESAGAGLFE